MRKVLFTLAAVCCCICLAVNAFADIEAAKKECVEKCEAAAKMISEQGLDAAIAEINKKDGKFVSDVTYVFLQKMDGTMLAHPIKASLIGKNLIDLKDSNGKAFFQEFVKVAKESGTGWVDYMWPKPGEEKPSEKTSYVLKVNDEIFVGAGVYK